MSQKSNWTIRLVIDCDSPHECHLSYNDPPSTEELWQAIGNKCNHKDFRVFYGGQELFTVEGLQSKTTVLATILSKDDEKKEERIKDLSLSSYLLTVKFVTGTVYQVLCQPSDSASVLYNSLARQTKSDINRLRIFRNGVFVRGIDSLAKQNVSSDSKLYASIV